MIDAARFAHALKARRAALSKEVLAIEDALDDPPSKDWEDRAAERQGDEVLEARGTQDLSELTRDDTIMVCGGIDVQDATTKKILGWLRREARKGLT